MTYKVNEYVRALTISFKTDKKGNKVKRDHKLVEGIAIHGTGNKGDTAINNMIFFAMNNKGPNAREAGAHFFVDRYGMICKSIPMDAIAFSVGDNLKQGDGAATYYGMLGNENTVSIELCDIADKDPSPEQIGAVKWLITYIQKYCPNAKKIVRHYDISGKICPNRMAGTPTAEKRWKKFLKAVKPE